MALPHPKISPIPQNEPYATPALWNVRYDEIDKNFKDLDTRAASTQSEVANARGGKGNLGARLGELEDQVNIQSLDYQNAEAAALLFAMTQAALANRSVQALKEQVQQESEIVIQNRGVVFGCAITRSNTAARNLNLVSGRCFAHGRVWPVSAGDNAASVPPNISSAPVMVHAYLHRDVTLRWRLAVTAIGQSVPEDGIRIYNVTIPPNSTDATDPYLESVTITDVRRLELRFPTLLDNPASVSTTLQRLSANDYRVDLDVVSSVGAPCAASDILVTSRATNGLTFQLASAADSVRLRYRISKLNN